MYYKFYVQNFYRLSLLTTPEQLKDLERCLESLATLLGRLNSEDKYKFHEVHTDQL